MMALGAWLGYAMTNKLAIRFDKEKKLVELPGSWTTLISLLMIFSVRCCLGIAYGLHPEWSGNQVLFSLEGIAIAISGTFIGRLLGILQKYRMAAHEKLA